MKRRAAIVRAGSTAGAVIAAVAVLALSSGVAHAADPAGGTATIQFSAQSWYGGSGCLLPGVCSSALSTKPSGLLHVGVALGAETSRTYLTLPAGAISADVTGAELKLPLDLSAAAGSHAPTKAAVEVCITAAAIKTIDGGGGKPPAADCTGHVAASITGGKELDADLGSLLGLLSKPGASLALIPVLVPADVSTWEVSFVTATNGAIASPSLTLTVPSAAPQPTDSTSPTPDSGSGSGAGTGADLGDLLGDGGTAPPVVVDPTSTSGTASAPVPTASAASAPVPQLVADAVVPHGFEYPAIFLLVLAVGTGVLVLGRQLTRPLTPKRRAGASGTHRTATSS